MKYKVIVSDNTGLQNSNSLTLEELKKALFVLSRMGYSEEQFIIEEAEE